MSEKNLSESDWKKFSKGQDFKDAALLKALAVFEKAEKSGPAEQQLKALDELDKQAQALLKLHKGDKPLAAYIADLDKSLAKQRKAAEAQHESESQEDEEEGTPDLLGAAMVPALRMVKKGDTVLQAMIATAGKDTVVLVSRKAIGAPRRKQLAATLGASGGVKYFTGECIWEENALTFVLQAPGGGLAKKIRAALLDQTQQRFKVRVRGEDGAVDDDGEPAEQEQGEAESHEDQTPQQRAEHEYAQRWVELGPRYTALLARLPEAAGAKLRAVQAFAEAKAKAGAHPAALQGLDSLVKLMEQAQAPGATTTPTAPTTPTATTTTATNPAADLARHRATAKSLLETWRDAKEAADVGLSRLQSALKATNEPALLRIADAGLHGISGRLQVGLRVALEDFARQTDPAGGATQKLRQGVADFRRFLDTDPAVQLCDDNPFDIEVGLRPTLGAALRNIDQALDAVNG